MVSIVQKIMATAMGLILYSNGILPGTMGSEHSYTPSYYGLYVGGALGAASLIDKQFTNTPPDAHRKFG